MNIKTTSGPVLEKPADLVGILTNQREGDILFIDEIHRLRPIIEEFLYPAMEDYRVEIRLSDGPKAQTMTMNIERFTLVGATTRFGLLTAPMRARFGIVQRLNFYPPEDLGVIIRRSAEILGVEATRRGPPSWPSGPGVRLGLRTACCGGSGTMPRSGPMGSSTGRWPRRPSSSWMWTSTGWTRWTAGFSRPSSRSSREGRWG